VNTCTPTPSQGSNPISYLNSDWATRPNGEIVNTDANLCLADRGSSTAKGSKLFLEACDGDAGQICPGQLRPRGQRRQLLVAKKNTMRLTDPSDPDVQ
jgi:hypothetical protein